MTGHDVVFTVLALVCVAAAVLAVTGRQVVHAALWLVVALAGLAGVFLVLGAEVVALVQLLVYVGAVVVLLLFALMLTRAPIGPRADLDASPRRRWAAAAAGLAVAGLVATTLLVAVGGRTIDVGAPADGPAAIGTAIFAGWLLPFELLSLLLLAALVGALAVSGATRRPEGPSWRAVRGLASSVRHPLHIPSHPRQATLPEPQPEPQPDNGPAPDTGDTTDPGEPGETGETAATDGEPR